MRPVKKRPRILNAKILRGLIVSAVFNNGETRIIDFSQVFDQIGINKNSPLARLRTGRVFSQFHIENGTLSWKNVQQDIPWNGAVRKLPFEIGADTLYKNSRPAPFNHRVKIGEMIRKERIAAGITQGDLAVRSGTTAAYISKIENDRSGIELDTLQKLVEQGLRKKLVVRFGNV
jgi:hypothetical protein